jgi:diacylglycerol O-acyltransferase
MSDTQTNQGLSLADALFLYLEQPGAPINVASIAAFEGVIPLEQCMQYVESKLPLIPRFLQRIVTPPCGIGSPTLQFDPHFDVRNHVREITLKHGTDREWKSAVSEILTPNMDRCRPLWDLTLIHGLKRDRTGVVVRIHHCLVDGVAGVALLNVLLDPSPVVQPISHKKLTVPAPLPHDPGTALLDNLISSCLSTAQALLTAHSELLRMAQQATHPIKNETGSADIQPSLSPLACIAPLGDLARLLSELAKPTERLPFNKLCHGPQKFDWTEIPMAEIVAVKQACNATVNEVVLTVLGAALRRYAELHNLNVAGRNLRLVIPVNVRTDGTESVTGNQITFLPVDIPHAACEPREFLSLVQKRVKFSKTAHGAELVALAGILVSAMPATLQSLAGTILSQLPVSLCNSICTNVHGPKVPLYLLGHRMLSSYPCVPIGGEMGMNCAVMSYDGHLFVGFTGNAEAIPDLPRLVEFFNQSFVELRDAVGVRIPKVKRSRPKRKAAVKKVQEAPAFSADATPSDATPAESPTEAVFA